MPTANITLAPAYPHTGDAPANDPPYSNHSAGCTLPIAKCTARTAGSICAPPTLAQGCVCSMQEHSGATALCTASGRSTHAALGRLSSVRTQKQPAHLHPHKPPAQSIQASLFVLPAFSMMAMAVSCSPLTTALIGMDDKEREKQSHTGERTTPLWVGIERPEPVVQNHAHPTAVHMLKGALSGHCSQNVDCKKTLHSSIN